jgi:hypothetical protein
MLVQGSDWNWGSGALGSFTVAVGNMIARVAIGIVGQTSHLSQVQLSLSARTTGHPLAGLFTVGP